MDYFKKNRRITSLMLITILLLPVLLVSVAPLAYSADNNTDEKQSWLKGILLILTSFLINRFIDNPGDKPKPNYNDGQAPEINLEPDNVKQNKPEVLGFYVNWLTQYASSYESLQDYHSDMDMVSPFWYTVNPDGSVESRYGGHQYEVSSLAKNNNLKVLPLINNSQLNNMAIVDSKIREKAVNNIVNLIDKYNYQGVNIDFEFIPSWTRDSYTTFIRLLSEKLPDDKLLTISVFPKIDVPLSLQGAYDYAALAPYIDRMVIMSYDNHWSSGPAGPIAPIDWVEKNIKYAVEYITPEKILLGIANYGYDWPATGIARDVSIKEAEKIARDKGAEILWDEEYQTPYYYYWNNNTKHEVWYENSHSMAFKLDLVKKYNLQGIAIWRLGNETEKFWKMIRNKLG